MKRLVILLALLALAAAPSAFACAACDSVGVCHAFDTGMSGFTDCYEDGSGCHNVRPFCQGVRVAPLASRYSVVAVRVDDGKKTPAPAPAQPVVASLAR